MPLTKRHKKELEVAELKALSFSLGVMDGQDYEKVHWRDSKGQTFWTQS